MQKLLVIRNDKIGDFMLAWPAFAMLKQSLPNTQIVALVPTYTAELARLCPYIDEIILDCANDDKTENQRVLNEVKSYGFSAVVSFISRWHNAKLVWRSGIRYRLAPATKIFQFLYNYRLVQRRSRSEKAEFEYNLDLARYFLRSQNVPIVEPTSPYLIFSDAEITSQKQKLIESLGLAEGKKWVFVHSSTGGSATNLSLEQYAQLINGIQAQFECQVVLTAGSNNEAERAKQLADLLVKPAAIYAKNEGLADFCCSLACADLFISGSTGPLHICGALNIPTIGFYPSHLSAIPTRWRPINEVEKHLAFAAPKGKKTEKNLTLISIKNALPEIIPFVRKMWV